MTPDKINNHPSGGTAMVPAPKPTSAELLSESLTVSQSATDQAGREFQLAVSQPGVSQSRMAASILANLERAQASNSTAIGILRRFTNPKQSRRRQSVSFNESPSAQPSKRHMPGQLHPSTQFVDMTMDHYGNDVPRVGIHSGMAQVPEAASFFSHGNASPYMNTQQESDNPFYFGIQHGPADSPHQQVIEPDPSSSTDNEDNSGSLFGLTQFGGGKGGLNQIQQSQSSTSNSPAPMTEKPSPAAIPQKPAAATSNNNKVAQSTDGYDTDTNHVTVKKQRPSMAIGASPNMYLIDCGPGYTETDFSAKIKDDDWNGSAVASLAEIEKVVTSPTTICYFGTHKFEFGNPKTLFEGLFKRYNKYLTTFNEKKNTVAKKKSARSTSDTVLWREYQHMVKGTKTVAAPDLAWGDIVMINKSDDAKDKTLAFVAYVTTYKVTVRYEDYETEQREKENVVLVWSRNPNNPAPSMMVDCKVKKNSA